MPRNYYFLISFFVFFSTCTLHATEDYSPAWTELGPNGITIARVATMRQHCPTILLDKKQQPMHLRATPNKNYAIHICEVTIPPTTKSAKILGHKLSLLKANPERIVVIGDTGCKLKVGKPAQACNDAMQWPFAKIAQQAAHFHPDLVIHVGDYIYREAPCPKGDKGCQGSPYGYNWPTWKADFFKPAQPLLSTAPWVFVRGNHEDCQRAGEGWFRILDPFPYVAKCQEFSPLYSVPVGNIQLFVMDSSSADDNHAPGNLVAQFKTYFAALHSSPAKNIWLATHKPIWTAVDPERNKTLQAALLPQLPATVSLLLAGHVHDFEAINFKQRPSQLIIGNSGTELESTVMQGAVHHLTLNGQQVTQGIVIHKFGYLALIRRGNKWQGELHGINGNVLARCTMNANKMTCI